MFLLDFDHTPRKAFLHGFMKGLAAPVMLHHQERVTIQMPTTITIRNRHPLESLGEDWNRIGGDLRAVIERYRGGAE